MDENPYQATVFERGPEGSLPDRVLWLGQWRRRMFWVMGISIIALVAIPVIGIAIISLPVFPDIPADQTHSQTEPSAVEMWRIAAWRVVTSLAVLALFTASAAIPLWLFFGVWERIAKWKRPGTAEHSASEVS